MDDGKELRTGPRIRLRHIAPRPAGARIRHGLICGARGLVLAVLSQLVSIPLFIAAVLSIAFLGLGVGVFLVPAVMVAVRAHADLQRRLALEWSGMEIAAPYRPRPDFAPLGVIGCWQRCRWLPSDPATWRDLLWTLANVPVGLLLGLLPGCLIVYGVEGIVVAPWLWTLTWYGYGAIWPIDDWLTGLLTIPQALVILPLAVAMAPMILRGHALFTRSLLSPTRETELALRVHHLTETRTEALDSSAAELRRIERDLHDGAQARLAALGMSLGMAEDLLTSDPEAAQRLVSEARQASGQALTELRDLVRGVHPPVLAERGLDGAVRALALTLPHEVDITINLVGRPPAPIETAAYFAAAEALANVAKHGYATSAWIRLEHSGGRLRLLVGDDGAGGADEREGSGLRGIRRRLAVFDGIITVTSPPGGPTVLTMEIPCELSSPKTSPSSGTD